jgi:hypothetical protein
LSFTCKETCGAVLDANGVAALLSERTPNAEFAFELSATASGAKAVGRTGTTWSAITWECPTTTCNARISETGVSRVAR